MDKLFPFLKRLGELRKADPDGFLPLLLKACAAALGLAGLMLSIAFWTSIDGLSLADFFMLSLVQVLVILAVWAAAHCFWLSAESGKGSAGLPALFGEVLAIALLFAGSTLFIAGFFPGGRMVSAFLAAFPLIGGFHGPAGGIAALALSLPMAGLSWGFLGYLGRRLSRTADERDDTGDEDDQDESRD